MTNTRELYSLWAVDLSESSLERLSALARGRFTLELKEESDLLFPDNFTGKELIILCLSAAAWKNLLADKDKSRDFIARMPKIIILPADCSIEEIEDAAQYGFSAILKEPLCRDRVLSAIADTVESQLIFSDVLRMTKEIILDRELIARKNHNLSFLLDFLSRTAAQVTPVEVMEAAWESLRHFLPVESIGAAFWRSPSIAIAPATAHLFIPAENNTDSCGAWIKLLLKAEKEFAPFPMENYVHETLTEGKRRKRASDLAPRQKQTLVAPLKSGSHTTGAIALSFSEPCDMTRDRLDLLESALGHLDLAMRNAFLFLFNRRHAELDTLTTAYNRRHFEETIEQELIRHQRCHDGLTLLLVDIDHFKNINDTYGHQIGDKVLCELVSIMQTRLRSVDYLARYGGEEFVIILPHTDADDAARLAERLRKAVSGHAFAGGSLEIPVTISVGLAPCPAETRLSSQELFHNADMAMYRAKHQGRNQVCRFCGQEAGLAFA